LEEAPEDEGVEQEGDEDGGGVGVDEADGAAAPGREGAKEQEEGGGKQFHSGAGGKGTDAAQDGGEVLVQGEEENGGGAAGDEGEAAGVVGGGDFKELGGDPGREQEQEQGDAAAGGEEAKELALEPPAKAAFALEMGGVAFADVREAEEDQRDDPVDDFEGGLVEPEFGFARRAEEACDDQEADEGETARDDDDGDVGGGGSAGRRDGLDLEVSFRIQTRSPSQGMDGGSMPDCELSVAPLHSGEKITPSDGCRLGSPHHKIQRMADGCRRGSLHHNNTRDRMILDKVLDHAIATPNAVAIVDDKRTITYRELVWGAHLFVGMLEEMAPREQFGDKVALLIPPTAAFAVAFGGTRWAGRIAMPLNYLLKPEEMVPIIQDSGVKVVFTIEFFKPLIEPVAAATGLKVVYMETLKFEKPGFAAMASIGMNAANLRKHVRPFPERGPDDVAVIMYTSGTSGTPKGVMLTNHNLESNALDSCEHARFNQKTIFLGVLPMFHTLGLMGCMLIPLMLGSKVVCQARFSPMGVFEAVKAHGVEVLIMVPTMYSVLASAKAAKPEALGTVKICISGGEPLPVALIEQFRGTFGHTLMEGFGLTETSPIVALNVPWDHKPGSVGKVIPHVRIKTVDDEGRELAATVDGGELYIHGPNVMKGYYNKPELSAEVLVKDAEGTVWFKTGDVAKVDAEGFLFITGRKKDMIIMAGEKVFPREIEDALKQHPAVLHAAVIGIKDESRGEMPIAFIQLKPETAGEAPAIVKPTASELRAFVRERIAPYKTPREIYFIDAMPLTPTGKVLKRALVVPA
jgi:long-chain acyl-CoA synthetase